MNPGGTHRLHGEVESPRPLRAVAGVVSITGWCLIEGGGAPPAVRFATPVGNVPQSERRTRPDLASRMPAEPAAPHCGFVLAGPLGPGVHSGRFEAQLSDGSWRAFKELSIAVEMPPFAAGIDAPASIAPVRERAHVEGWALHPSQPVKSLSIRYGHQEIGCAIGRDRPDVAQRHPATPHAAHAGFKSEVVLSAGRGPLRVKAHLADGSVAVARTTLTIAIEEDENHSRHLGLDAARVPLPVAPPQSIAAATTVAAPLRILFILPGSFAANNALHVAGLANELAAAGHCCAVAVARDPETISHHFAPQFTGVSHAAARAGQGFPDGAAPDVIHAWTTRENVRRLAQDIRQLHPRARLVVHLEDNEQEVLAQTLGRPAAELAALDDAALDALVPADLSHPRRSRAFLAAADGVTLINRRLGEALPAGARTLTFTPGADARFFFPRPVPTEFRDLLGLAPGTAVLFYHGNVHAANAAEMRELYAAILRLNRSGLPTVLLRTGLDTVDFLGPLAGEVADRVIPLGQVHHHRHLPPLMALADIFVQPGAPDAFNDYRFPSKLPEFFALGRPVVLPRTNLGLQVRHGTDAWVLDRADAAGIATAVTAIRQDRALAARLAAGAAAYAAAHFNWRQSAAALAKFYASLTT